MLAFKCDNGFEPRGVGNPTSAADCAPIVCPAHMSLTPIKSGCRGCPPGSFGDFSDPTGSRCSACPNASLCPGFLQAALPADPSVLGLPLGAPLPPPASLLAANPASAVTLFPALLVAPPSPFSFFQGNSLIAGLAGFALSVVVLLTVVVDLLQGGTLLNAFLRRVDAFSVDHMVLKEGEWARKRSTALGGGCTLVMFLTFSTFAALLFLRRYTDNVLTTNSIVVLSGLTSAMARQPWARPKALPQRPGVRINVFSLAALGTGRGACGAPLAWAASGLAGGAWALSNATADSRTHLTFACVDCTFTATSTLTFSLPFTCQSLYMEATAVDPLGQVRALALSPAVTTATSTELLTGITWNLEVILAVLLDLTDSSEGGGTSARGYQVLSSTGASDTAFPGSGLVPATSAVRVAVTLSLQPTFTLTQLTQKLSLADLGASIIGLAGLISFFRALFQYTEVACGRSACACACARRPSAAGLTKHGGAAPPAPEPEVVVGNPLHTPRVPPAEEEASLRAAVAHAVEAAHSARRIEPPPLKEEPLAPGDAHAGEPGPPWRRHADDAGDVWFVQEGTQATVWELPPGAVLLSEPSGRRSRAKRAEERSERFATAAHAPRRG